MESDGARLASKAQDIVARMSIEADPAERPARASRLALLAVVAAVAWRFSDVAAAGVFPIADDTLHLYYPLAATLFGALAGGGMPAWSPELLLGYPVLGSVDVHAFSPFHWPYLFFPPHVAVALRFVSLTLCSALFLYALARQMGTKPAGAATAAVLWVTCRPAMVLQIEPMASATVPWLPLVLLCWHRAGADRRWSWAAAAGGALGLALLGGHAQLVYWFVVFAVVYAVCLPGSGIGHRRLKGVVLGAVTMTVVAGMIGAVNILSTAALLQDSVRATLEPADRVAPAILEPGGPARRTVRLVAQTIFSGAAVVNVANEYFRVGLLPVALALLSFGRGRSLENRLGLSAIVFLMLASATVFPPTQWLLQVLPAHDFRHPGRIGLMFTLAVVLLAGRGMDRLVDDTADVSQRRLGLLALASGALLLSGLGANGDRLHAGDVVSFMLLAVSVVLRLRPRHALYGRLAALTAALVFVLQVRSQERRFMQEWAPVASRLGGSRSGLYERLDGSGEAWPPAWLRDVPKQDAYGPTRVLMVSAGTPPADNAPLLTTHQTPLGYVSLRPARVEHLVYQRRRVSDDDRLMLAPNLLDLLNVAYVVIDRESLARSRARQAPSRLSVLSEAGAWSLARNASYLPRAFFIDRATIVRGESEAFSRVTDVAFDPRREVVIEGEESEPAAADGEPVFVPATVVRYENERVEVELQAPRPGWLVLLDRHAAGWSCTLDGRPTPISRGNYLFRAVRVPVGRARLAFRYDAPHRRRGAGLTLAGLFVAGVGVFRCTAVAKRDPPNDTRA